MAGPVWKQNLHDAILLDPLTLIHGNVKDLFFLEDGRKRNVPEKLQRNPYVTLDIWLALEYEKLGFDVVLIYDSDESVLALRGEMVSKFQSYLTSDPVLQQSQAKFSNNSSEQKRPVSTLPKSEDPAPSTSWMAPIPTRFEKPLDLFQVLYTKILPNPERKVALICRFSDRYLRYTDQQDNEERRLSLLIQKSAMSIKPPSSDKPVGSRIALLFDLEGSIPQELNTCAPFAHSVLIPSPTFEERRAFFRNEFCQFESEPGDRFNPEEDVEHLDLLCNLSDGLKLQDMLSLIGLSKTERIGIGPNRARQLLDRFRFGTVENPWSKISNDTLRNAKQILQKRVKGQDAIIDDIVPTLIRAKMGMSDDGNGKNSSRPRGVFFFVGPTGVGKTELSKSIAELIFGNENALIRFDMSEYSEEHAQSRLLGAPPGYVGFDQGGQLTNAINEKPFSVVLFDEIEKAHPRIWDKFLQVLDDGRLTDGRGRTVYFSEAVLIFTSNLGTARRSAPFGGGMASLAIPNETINERHIKLQELDYKALCDYFREQVKDFFVNELGRPEVLNRVGEDNILVFNYLKDESAKQKIVSSSIERLDSYLRRDFGVGFRCTDSFRQILLSHPAGFKNNGARGVRNLLSKWVLNKVAEDLFLEGDNHRGKIFCAIYKKPLDQVTSEPFDKELVEYRWENM